MNEESEEKTHKERQEDEIFGEYYTEIQIIKPKLSMKTWWRTGLKSCIPKWNNVKYKNKYGAREKWFGQME